MANVSAWTAAFACSRVEAPAMGPLGGFRVIELAGIGPAPMGGMMLADMGADVIRIERSLSRPSSQHKDISDRGKRSIVLDLKTIEGVEVALRLIDGADVLIEPYRPGVAERLGLGPDICLGRNSRLLYARMTGWGQQGPLAQAAGHDINYIALTGALHAIGRRGERPVPPLNLVGDMGGGGMLLAYAVVCGVLEARLSGKGQVVDVAMIDGAAQMMWMFHGFHASGQWDARERSVNLLDGGAPFYDTYETSDGKFIAIGAIEPHFFALLIERIGADPAMGDAQADVLRWPELREELSRIFLTRSREEWTAVLEGCDACFAPVLPLDEAPYHPHSQARNSYVTLDGVIQPAPAPRFSRTVAAIRHAPHPAGFDGELILKEAGFFDTEIEHLQARNILGVYREAADGRNNVA